MARLIFDPNCALFLPRGPSPARPSIELDDLDFAFLGAALRRLFSALSVQRIACLAVRFRGQDAE